MTSEKQYARLLFWPRIDLTMHFLDWIIIGFFFVAIIIVGLISGSEKNKSDSFDEYALAGRNAPWWLVFISIYATSASALTFIGIPGSSYMKDLRYLNLAFGAILGRYLIARILLPLYYEHKVASVYELLEIKLGPETRLSGAGYFFITRLLASSVRLAACSIAVSVIFNLEPALSIFLIMFVALMYTQLGGMKAVLWTDFIQFFIFFIGALVVLFFIESSLPMGFDLIFQAAEAKGKLNIFSVSLSGTDSLFTGFIFGALLNFAALGTDQDLVQRMLTCKTLKESKKALMVSAIAEIPMTFIFLLIGVFLFIYFDWYPYDEVSSLKSDQVFPWFISNVLPPGLRGFLLAGLLAAALSSLDSALNALATSFVTDCRKLIPANIKNSYTLKGQAKVSVFIFGLILSALALLFVSADSILWVGFKVAGYTYGALLGIFLAAIYLPSNQLNRYSVVIMIFSSSLAFLLTGFATSELNQLTFLFPWESSKTYSLLIPWQVGLIASVLGILTVAFILKKTSEIEE